MQKRSFYALGDASRLEAVFGRSRRLFRYLRFHFLLRYRNVHRELNFVDESSPVARLKKIFSLNLR